MTYELLLQKLLKMEKEELSLPVCFIDYSSGEEETTWKMELEYAGKNHPFLNENHPVFYVKGFPR
jgi:hypothetical protein